MPFLRLLSLLVPLFLMGCLGPSVKDLELEKMIGQDFYLKVNVWYEKPGKIMSTNYHKGSILKVGTKFKLTGIGGKKISFSSGKGIEYTLVHHRKHSPGDLEALFNGYFGKRDVTKSAAFKKFTNKEQKQVLRGEIVKGMSKAAVAMSYGRPPAHRTPSLDVDRWIYWDNRWISKAAIFENGKLLSYK